MVFQQRIVTLLKRALAPTICGLALAFTAACSCTNENADQTAVAMVGEVRMNLPPIKSGTPNGVTEAQQAYLDYYRIRVDPAKYRFGTFESDGEALSTQFYRPANSRKGTVIIVHGYLDHTGSEANLIGYLASAGYHVATYDQPGHGLSGGDRVSSGSFAAYRTAFSDFLTLVQSSCPPPYDVVGHSQGATVIADHLLKYDDTPLRRAVLVTPLIKDVIPRPLRRLGIVLSPVVEYLPRIPQNNSSDEELGPRVMADPLQARCVSTHSGRAFAFWQHRNRNAPPSEWSPLVLYAEIETVVDEEYSKEWMRRTFPKARAVDIGGGSRHQLLNEVEPLRKQVLEIIGEELPGLHS